MKIRKIEGHHFSHFTYICVEQTKGEKHENLQSILIWKSTMLESDHFFMNSTFSTNASIIGVSVISAFRIYLVSYCYALGMLSNHSRRHIASYPPTILRALLINFLFMSPMPANADPFNRTRIGNGFPKIDEAAVEGAARSCESMKHWCEKRKSKTFDSIPPLNAHFPVLL